MNEEIEYHVNMSDFNTITSISRTCGRVWYKLPYPGNRFYKSTPNKISLEKYLELKDKYFKGVTEEIYDFNGRFGTRRNS